MLQCGWQCKWGMGVRGTSLACGVDQSASDLTQTCSQLPCRYAGPHCHVSIARLAKQNHRDSLTNIDSETMWWARSWLLSTGSRALTINIYCPESAQNMLRSGGHWTVKIDLACMCLHHQLTSLHILHLCADAVAACKFDCNLAWGAC